MTIYCNNSIQQFANQMNVFGGIPASEGITTPTENPTVSVGGNTVFGSSVGIPVDSGIINTWGYVPGTPYISEDTFIPETPLPSAANTAFASMSAMQMAMQMPMMPAMQMPNFNFNF